MSWRAAAAWALYVWCPVDIKLYLVYISSKYNEHSYKKPPDQSDEACQSSA